MSQKRFLTPEEKAHCHKVALAKEQHDFPDHDIEVTVLDETDDEGNPLWTVQKKKVIVLPKDWESSR